MSVADAASQPSAGSGLGKLVAGCAGYQIGNEIAHDLVDTITSYFPHALTAPAENLLTMIIIGAIIFYTPGDVIGRVTAKLSTPKN